jgi:hypothetical protein
MQHYEYGDVSAKMKSFTEIKQYLKEETAEQTVEFDLDGKSIEDVTAFLDSQGISYTVDEDGYIYVDDNDVQEETITEGSVKRKLVVRSGRKKIVFVCAPGKKKVGRTCMVRKSSDLAKLKRRNKRSARKAKSKHSASVRKQKLANKRRKAFGLNKK